jgi:hypothetical protein
MLVAVLLLAASSGAGRYPMALQVQSTDAARAATYSHQQDFSGLHGPPAETSVSFVGKQAVDAYTELATRLFQADAQPRLTLTVVSVKASLAWQNDAWHGVVQHELELRDAHAKLLGSWTVEGRGGVYGLGEGAVPAAFQAATTMAERAFEARFEEPAGVAAFLAGAGVSPGSVGRRAAVAEAPPPPPPAAPFIHPEPTEPRAYLDVGGHVTDLSYQSTSHASVSATNNVLDRSQVTPGMDLRLGIAGGWFFAQGVFSTGGARDGAVEHSLTSFGGDAGVRVKLNRTLQVAGGVGLSSGRVSVSTYDFGPNPVTQVTTQLYPDLMASIYMTPPLGQRFHLHGTLEARYRLTSFDTSYVDGTYQDHWASGFSLALLFGVDVSLVPQGKK